MRFYGGSLSDWLRLPVDQLRLYLEAANVLETRERISAILDGQMASGFAKKHDVSSYLSKLRRQARYRKSSRPATAADLAQLGLVVVQRGK